jgi:putative endonuclease
MSYYLYIIQSSKDESYYVGTTQNLDDRLARHNHGRSKFTKAKCPWQFVYFEEYPDRSCAMKKEYAIKRKKKRAYIEQLIRPSRPLGRDGREFPAQRDPLASPRRSRY